MKNQVFRLTWCRLNGYEFRLAWNGFAMSRWKDAQIDVDALYQDSTMLATALNILGEAAAAVLRYCNYPPDEVPDVATLEHHFDVVATLWERDHAFAAIVTALQCGSDRQYAADEAEDIDTIELKKN